jgi:hypothetical protein
MTKHCALLAVVLLMLAAWHQTARAADKPLETIVLKNDRGLQWELPRYAHGWTLGTVSLNHKSVDVPMTAGMIGLRDLKTHKQVWLAAATGQRVDDRTARFAGSKQIGGVTFGFEMEVALKPAMPAAAITTRWTVDKDLDGYEVCLAYHDVGRGDWRCTFYPFAGNSALKE